MNTERSKARQRVAKLAARYPYVLIDRILEIDASARSIRAAKNFSFTEPYFAGHFPGNPIVPGVLQMMAVLQAAELAVGGQAVRLLRAKRFHFRAPVRPGDDFVIELTTVEQNDAEWTVRASGSVNGEERVKGTLVLSTAPTVRRVSSRNESKGYWSSARLLLGARETGG